MEYFITEYNNMILTAGKEGNRFVSLDFEDKTGIRIGNIYIGKVKNIIKNIDAAFIEIANKEVGYYSLKDNPVHIFMSSKKNNKLVEGDEILVQVEKDSMKMKQRRLTSNISFNGEYIVLSVGKSLIGVSSKIKNQNRKDHLKQLICENAPAGLGFIARTKAGNALDEDILKDINILVSKWTEIYDNAKYLSCFSAAYEEIPDYIKILRDTESGSIDRVVTDIPEVFENLREFGAVLYDDTEVSLLRLQGLETVINRSISNKVWLKSGGFLYIEPTEALVSIDVNTGKFTGNKNSDDTIFEINKEAAAEAMHQIRLRNLSGIIIIDFIDMKSDDYNYEIINIMEELGRRDKMRVDIHGFTKLGLLELTRKKEKKSLHEIFA